MNKTKRIKKMKSPPFVIFATLILLSSLLINGCTNTSQQIKSNTNTNVVLGIGKEAPDVTFTTIDGKEQKLSDYREKKVMFWYIATWCPSCIKAAQVLEQNNNKLKNIEIIVLKTYGNAGYNGPTISEFGQKYSPNALSYDNWVWGDASQQGTRIYNSRNYPDIYFLIDEKGILRGVDGAPAATLNKIISFAQE